MKYIIALLAGYTLVDFARSALRIRKVYAAFYGDHTEKPDRSHAVFGSGKPFHLAILGDSTFDVHSKSKVPYGPAQPFIDRISKSRKTHVHFFASAGAKTNDVIQGQLSELKNVPKVDLVLVYMGANDVVTGHWPGKVGKAYETLLGFTEQKQITVVASELANYWHFSLFPRLYRAWLYIAIHIANAGLRSRAKRTKYVAVTSVKKMHRTIHKNRKTEPYLLDGFHPDDRSSIKWGEVMLEKALLDPKTKQLFTDIMS